MKIIRSDLDTAVQKNLLTADQAAKLWAHFEDLRPEQPRFQGLHVLYYFGGLLILGSMSWFLTKEWDNGPAVTAIAGVFATLYLLTGHNLWTQQKLKIPGGLLITAAVGLVPVFVYGLQQTLGLWPQSGSYSHQDFHHHMKTSFLRWRSPPSSPRCWLFVFTASPSSLSRWPFAYGTCRSISRPCSSAKTISVTTKKNWFRAFLASPFWRCLISSIDATAITTSRFGHTSTAWALSGEAFR